MSELINGEKEEMIHRLMTLDQDCLEFCVSLEFDKNRYEWRDVNWTRFLFDKQEELYIPEQVYIDILSRKLRQESEL